MKRRTAWMSAAAVVSLTTLLAGCSSIGGTQASAPKRTAIPNGGTLVETFPTAFGTNMIPFLDSSAYTATADSYAFDSLLNFNQKDQLVPDLVDKYAFSKSKTTITFWLNPKARWSNGAPVTSKDVQLSVDWLASKTYNVTDQGAYGYLVQNIVGASKPLPDGTTPSGFKIINSHEFSISMAQPDAAVLPSQWAGIIPLPSAVLGKMPMSAWKSSSFNKVPTIGSGPFVFKSLVPGQSITQVRNPYYVFGAPHIQTVVWKVISPNVVNGDLASGQVDIAGIHPQDVQKMKALPNLSVAIFPSNSFGYLGWRLNNAKYGSVFSNVKFRQAVEYAINRPALVKAIDKGYGKPENGPLPPINFWYNSKLNNTYAYSPATANKLLDSIGMKVGANGWRTMPNGKPFSPTLTISTGDSNIVTESTFIAQFMKAVHINLTVLPPINFNTMLSQLNNDSKGTQPIQGFLLGWSLSDDPDPRGLWRSTDNLNITSIDWTNTKDPAIVENDRLIHLQHSAAAFNLAYRKKIIYQWQTLLNQQMPENFLTMDDAIYAYNKNVHGLVFSAYTFGTPIDAWKWWMSPAK